MFKPLSDRILVKRVEHAGKSAGGILIPDSAQEKPMEGMVIAVGPGKYDKYNQKIQMSVKKGDRVVFGKWSGNEIEIDKEPFTIIVEDDIIGILK